MVRTRTGQFVSRSYRAQRRDLHTGSFVPFPTARQAGRDVAVEVQSFVTSLELFRQLIGANADDLVMAHALDLQARIQMRCPVLTGRLRNSFHVIPPNTSGDRFRYTDSTGRSFNGALDGERTGPGEAVVGTNVPYALAIEAGGSRQAPQGMVAVSVKEKTDELDKELEAATVRLWNRLG